MKERIMTMKHSSEFTEQRFLGLCTAGEGQRSANASGTAQPAPPVHRNQANERQKHNNNRPNKQKYNDLDLLVKVNCGNTCVFYVIGR